MLHISSEWFGWRFNCSLLSHLIKIKYIKQMQRFVNFTCIIATVDHKNQEKMKKFWLTGICQIVHTILPSLTASKVNFTAWYV